MKAYTITPKGQVTIPAEIREKLKLYPGDKITYEDSATGILIKPTKKDMMADFGFLRKREPAKSLVIIFGAGRCAGAVRRTRWK